MEPLPVASDRKFRFFTPPNPPWGEWGRGGGGLRIFIDFWSKGHFKVVKGRKRSKYDHFSTFSDFNDQ